MRHQFTPADIERFWSKVDRSGGPDACWPFFRARKNGYGQIGGTRKGKKWCIYGHRFAWMLAYGPIPDGMKVCHNCPDGDNPACCNPAHLFLGTQADNIADAVAKGRIKNPPYAQGEAHYKARLTDADVLAIRTAHTHGESLTSIGRRYGAKIENIYSIVHRRSWKHI